MEITLLLSFLGAAILLTLMPGPDNLFVLAQSISNGKNSGIATAFGLCTGLIFHISAATLGISTVIYQSAIAFSIVKYAGALYLLFLAYKAFTAKASNLNVEAKDTSNYRFLYRKGVIMNLLNPKVSLFFLAFLPQFVNQSAGNVTSQMLIYGLIFLVQALVIFSAISVLSGQISHYLRKHPYISRKINMVEGSLFAFIGLKIAFSEK
ncbi:LysE family translocator [Halobacillus massiliensis]|uniref:LysE family translocator n=1 Tax=Halobacillus massiliensis TaxID=1926286 RepID=UPI0009E31FDF|nr:LysE family translocator [Halobacillus massiliensis]